MEMLAFSISWKFGHFRRFYTTTSPLSFQIPPYTVIRGILGAILWYEKDIFNEKLAKIKIWISNWDVRKKKMFGMNYVDTRSPMTFWDHIQLKRQTILKPSYDIYILDQDFEDFEKLKKYLQEWKSEYWIYLGVAEYSANIQYIWTEKVFEKQVFDEKIETCVPEDFFDWWKNICLLENQLFEFENLPYKMDNQRNLTALKKIVFDPSGEKIKLKSAKVFIFWDKNILVC